VAGPAGEDARVSLFGPENLFAAQTEEVERAVDCIKGIGGTSGIAAQTG
jgi:hypothetical protein